MKNINKSKRLVATVLFLSPVLGTQLNALPMQSYEAQLAAQAEQMKEQALAKQASLIHALRYGLEPMECGFHIVEPPMASNLLDSEFRGVNSSEWAWSSAIPQYPEPDYPQFGSVPAELTVSIDRIFPNSTVSLSKVQTAAGWGLDANFDSSAISILQTIHGPAAGTQTFVDWYGVTHVNGGNASDMEVALVSDGEFMLKFSLTAMVASGVPQVVRVAEDLPEVDVDELLRKYGRGVAVDFCSPADLNQTGLPALLVGSMGSGVESGLHLEVSQGVTGSIGYVLVGTGMADPGLPIDNGHLCLATTGTNLMGRYNVVGGLLNSVGVFNDAGVLVNTTGTSNFETGYDVPSPLPMPIGGTILFGTQWHFQLWYRDGVGGSSNFSNGVSVDF